MIKKIFLGLLFIYFVFLTIFSSIYIFNWYKDNKSVDSQSDLINESVVIEDVTDGEAVGEEIPPFDPYWDYIKMDMMSVDFDELSGINSDVIGWVKVNGTNINYPFVQTKDNDYYLNHTFDGSKNGAGWVFLDYRNNISMLDKNNVIYAHGRQNKTLFGSLSNALSKSWYNDKNNHIIYLSTASEDTMWQVFSVYKLPTTSDYLSTVFPSDESFDDFVNMISDRSVYNFGANVVSSDKLLTLSTCYNNEEKMVMHAKLIKKRSK